MQNSPVSQKSIHLSLEGLKKYVLAVESRIEIMISWHSSKMHTNYHFWRSKFLSSATALKPGSHCLAELTYDGSCWMAFVVGSNNSYDTAVAYGCDTISSLIGSNCGKSSKTNCPSVVTHSNGSPDFGWVDVDVGYASNIILVTWGLMLSFLDRILSMHTFVQSLSSVYWQKSCDVGGGSGFLGTWCKTHSCCNEVESSELIEDICVELNLNIWNLWETY